MGRKSQERRARLTLLGAAVALAGASWAFGCDRKSTSRSKSAAKSAASSEGSTTGPAERGLSRLSAADKSAVVRSHAKLAHANYLDAAERAEWLAETARYLVERPSPDALDAARQAWLATRRPMCESEVFGFRGPRAARLSPGPMPDDRDRLRDAGLASEPDDKITRDDLLDRHTSDAPLVGAYAVEYLLWGVTGADRESPRDRWLELASELLADDAAHSAQKWAPGGARRRRLSSSPDRSLRRMTSRMVRINSRLLEHLGENDPSRNDGTPPGRRSGAAKRELLARFRGIANVYRGTYERSDNSRVEGPGVSTLVEELAPALDRRVRTQLERTRSALTSLRDSPSDLTDRSDVPPALERATDALEALHPLLEKVAARFDVDAE